MPGRDGTGPLGRGAMTGGGFGNCILPEDMYYQNRNGFPYVGRGCGFGRGFVRGHYADNYIPTYRNPTPEDEKQYLKGELQNLEQKISSIKSRLSEFDKK